LDLATCDLGTLAKNPHRRYNPGLHQPERPDQAATGRRRFLADYVRTDVAQ
jgi:hypothetical protein